MKKRLLSLFLTLSMALSLLPVSVWAADLPTSRYTIENDVLVKYSEEIKGADGQPEKLPILENVPIPSVKKIGTKAFFAKVNVKYVSIPSSVTEIEESAFIDAGLVEVIVPDTVETLGPAAFRGCRDLIKATLPSHLTEIPEALFADCNRLRDCKFPDGVTTIGNTAFSGTGLTSVAIPSSVKSIGSGAFSGSQLASVVIPDGVHIGARAFYETRLTSVHIPDSVKLTEDGIFAACAQLTNVVIPGNITRIPESSFSSCKSLPGIVIPDGVETIGKNAFSYCENLTSVTIPLSVKYIQNMAFYNCTALKDVYYAGNQFTWNNIQFNTHNECLTNATIHYNSTGPETDPGGSTEETDFPDLTQAGEAQIVSKYPELTDTNVKSASCTITFDKTIDHRPTNQNVAYANVNMENPFAIYRKSDDKLIYAPSKFAWTNFSGGGTDTVKISPTNYLSLLEPNTEYYITMGRGFLSFENGTYTNPEIKKGDWVFQTSVFQAERTFQFRSDFQGTAQATYVYSDEYFHQDSQTYNHALATMSMNLAAAAMNAFDAPSKGYKNTAAAKHIINLLNALQFQSIVTNSPTCTYQGKPQPNSIAAAFGKKALRIDNEDYTLIVVAIRGGGYETEWSGNFNVDSSGNHAGFQIASDNVLSGLKAYINDQNITGHIKIWITGYSRAAAVTNLTAAAIDDGKLFSGTNKVDRSGITMYLSDLYAYTFESPKPTTKANDTKRYANIFNIVNPIDLVPKVAPEGWNFRRFGTDCYMPSLETDANYYRTFIRQLQQEYKKIYGGSSDLIQQLNNQSSSLDLFLKELCDRLPRGSYSPKIEMLLTPVVAEAMSGANGDYREDIKKALQEFCRQHPKEALELLGGLKKVLGSKLFWCFVGEQATEQVASRIIGGSTLADTLGMVFDIILQSHQHELTLAWMHVITGLEEYGRHYYRRLYVNCPVDVSVYDSKNNLVGQIVSDEAQVVGGNGTPFIPAYVDGDGQKIFVLPPNEQYRVEIAATGNGTMTYTVEECVVDSRTTNRTVCYEAVPIRTGDKLTGTVEDLSVLPTEEMARYPLSSTDENNVQTPLKPTLDRGEYTPERPADPPEPDSPSTPSTPSGGNTGSSSGSGGGSDYDSSGSDDAGSSSSSFSINAPASVTGGKVSVQPTNAEKGDTITIMAQPNSGYQVGTMTVTDSKGKSIKVVNRGINKYVFTMPSSAVDVNVSFTAANAGQENNKSGFTDVPADAYYYNAVVWAKERGVTKDLTSAALGPDIPCTRALMVTFLWRAAGSPAPENPKHLFSDVQESAYYYNAVLWALEQGITAGTSESTFSPDATVTRGQAVMFLYRMTGSPKADGRHTFEDVSPDAYYTNAVQWAVGRNVVAGTSATTFSPNNPCLRAQILTFLYRAMA